MDDFIEIDEQYDRTEISEKNVLMYAIKNYDNEQCIDITELQNDLKKIKYLKKLFKNYTKHGILKERLILNHLITFFNVFKKQAAAKILFFKVNEEHYSVLKTFLIYLNVMPLELNPEVLRDEKVFKILQQIGKNGS